MPRERASTNNLARNAPLENIKEEEDQDHRRRELESQKARIVAQMVPVSASTTNLTTQNSVPGFSALSTAAASTTSTIAPRPASTVRSVVDENVPPSAASVITTASTNAGAPKSKKSALLIPVVPPSASKNAKAYDLFARTLNVAFQVKKEGKLFRDPSSFQVLYVGRY
jgi:cell cycle serine/threonine-protein kinase CDC5/MSD2